MMRFLMTLLVTAFAASLHAQSVEDGVRYAYYGRFKSAYEVFDKLVKANPADAQAQYWLGQMHIENKEIAIAKDIYTKALPLTNQAPLIMVGLGHVDLYENKPAEARAKFDAAIAATTSKKGKGDPIILRAVGRANADGPSTQGDPVYGIEKLQQAQPLDPKNAEIPLNIGISQLKRGPEYGGEAKRAYDQALDIDPKYARAHYRAGKIFESQRNPEQYLEFYNRAIIADPNFAPAYLALYEHYSQRDVNKAKEYLDQYIANSDKDKETEYFYADYLFRAGKYSESLLKAHEIEAGLNGEAFPKVNKLYAFNYNRLGDSVKAMQYMEKYMNNEVKEKISGDDYAMMASAYAKVPGNSVKADENFEKAIASDTAMARKVQFANEAAEMYGKSGNFADQFKWLSKRAAMKQQAGQKITETDYYYWADAGLKSGDYKNTEEVAKQYITAFPEKPQGYTFRVRAAIAADADTSAGTALAAIDQQNGFYMNDTARNKNRIINNFGYKVYYYANKAKDYPKAIEALDGILAIDPNNTYANDAKKQLQTVMNKKSGAPAAPAKPSGNGAAPAKPAAAPGAGGKA